MKSTKYGTISTGSKESSLTAKEILLSGGNAFDAAVAAVFTSMTSEFALTGPFGGGTCLGMKKGLEPFIYDFFVDSPSIMKQKKEFKEISVNFGNTTQEFFIGNGSIAPPGTLKGLIKLHKDHGVLPLENILRPAIDYAKEGVLINDNQAYIMNIIKPILNFSKSKLFKKNKIFMPNKDYFKNPDFADFLKLIINNGPEYFYKDKGLQIILNCLQDSSYLTKSDFTNYKVFKRKPISLKLNGNTIYTNPAPSYGGSLIIFLLKLIKESNNDISIFKLIQGMNLASQVRNEVCINPNEEFQIEKIFNSNRFDKYLNKFINDANLEFTPKLNGFGSTTHVSVMDNHGNAASITTTNGEGSGYIIPDYGIMMNNMLGEVDLNPFGFHSWDKKRRLPTMISPIIIADEFGPNYVLGSGGSNRIRSANIQVILNLLFNDFSLKKAISSPRIHLEADTLFHEPEINLPYKKLNSIKIVPFDKKSLFFGGVNAVSKTEAIGDERRGGVGLIVEK
tara:strand:+ start:670 stop:2190 length:1521 start_codon:yes stop_codon:yes gene_type:complete